MGLTACVTVRKKSGNDFVLRVFFGMCHQLRTEVTDSEEVIRPFNQLSVLIIKHWQAVETHMVEHRTVVKVSSRAHITSEPTRRKTVFKYG